MLIFYLQSLDTPILPNIAQVINLKDPALDQSINGWIFSFNPEKLTRFDVNTMDLGQLLAGFFEFYSTFYYEFIICPFFGTEMTRNTFRERAFCRIDSRLELTYPKPAKHYKWCFDGTGVFKRGL